MTNFLRSEISEPVFLRFTECTFFVFGGGIEKMTQNPDFLKSCNFSSSDQISKFEHNFSQNCFPEYYTNELKNSSFHFDALNFFNAQNFNCSNSKSESVLKNPDLAIIF